MYFRAQTLTTTCIYVGARSYKFMYPLWRIGWSGIESTCISRLQGACSIGPFQGLSLSDSPRFGDHRSYNHMYIRQRKRRRRRHFRPSGRASTPGEGHPHSRNSKPGTRNPKPETRSLEIEGFISAEVGVQVFQREVIPIPKTRNTKLEPRNPEPQT